MSKLFKSLREMPCLACGKKPSDVAHVKSRGAGGSDEEWNVIPLDRKCHSLSHQLGWYRFLQMYDDVAIHLSDLGWDFQYLNGKFIMTHPKEKA